MYGNRHKGGMNLIQALLWNAGNFNNMTKGKLKQDMPVRLLPMIVKVADEAVVAVRPL